MLLTHEVLGRGVAAFLGERSSDFMATWYGSDSFDGQKGLRFSWGIVMSYEVLTLFQGKGGWGLDILM